MQVMQFFVQLVVLIMIMRYCGSDDMLFFLCLHRQVLFTGFSSVWRNLDIRICQWNQWIFLDPGLSQGANCYGLTVFDITNVSYD
jgi:hypothetical protein